VVWAQRAERTQWWCALVKAEALDNVALRLGLDAGQIFRRQGLVRCIVARAHRGEQPPRRRDDLLLGHRAEVISKLLLSVAGIEVEDHANPARAPSQAADHAESTVARTVALPISRSAAQGSGYL
jgi:hypothetical protein